MNSSSEQRRINELRLYKILDTAAEKVFDDLTGLASVVCGAPISLVSLVDEHRQWFKSCHGLDVSETPRSQAFCAHAIQGDQVMVVEDAQLDDRFANNPLVTGDPKIRFYAGAPLTVANGASLGTLCIIDQKPRTLSSIQRQTLEVLRDAVVSQLEFRRVADDMRALQKVLPMCAWCRSVRLEDPVTENTLWQPLHEYVAEINPVTHGICPTCKESALSKKK